MQPVVCRNVSYGRHDKKEQLTYVGQPVYIAGVNSLREFPPIIYGPSIQPSAFWPTTANSYKRCCRHSYNNRCRHKQCSGLATSDVVVRLCYIELHADSVGSTQAYLSVQGTR